MQIGVPAETTAGETRVAVTPETAKKLKAQGHTLRVQSGAGLAASVTDDAYQAAGAEITDAAGAFGCELVLKVRNASDSEAGADEARHRRWSACSTPSTPTACSAWPRAGLTGFALEAAPRTTRAQSMDVLSSQANIAGYKAVMIGGQPLPALLPDADDRRRHGQGRARRDPGRGRRGPAGHRHGQAPGRGDRGLGRASQREGAGRVAGRQVHRRALRDRRKKKKRPKAWAATPGPCRRAGWTGRRPKSPSAWPRPTS